MTNLSLLLKDLESIDLELSEAIDDLPKHLLFEQFADHLRKSSLNLRLSRAKLLHYIYLENKELNHVA